MQELYEIAEYLEVSSELLILQAEKQLAHINEVLSYGNANSRNSVRTGHDIPNPEA
jgi:hypothetical protein